MHTRQRLNRGYFQGSLLVAGVIGWLTQSWSVFALTMAILVVLNIAAGEIRLTRRRP